MYRPKTILKLAQKNYKAREKQRNSYKICKNWVSINLETGTVAEFGLEMAQKYKETNGI